MVFGEVKSGKSVVRRIEELPTADGDRPRKAAAIADSGELTGDAWAAAEQPKQADALGDAYEDFPRDEETPEAPLTAARVHEIALACKGFGNAAFKAGDFATAVAKYRKGLRYLDEEPSLEGEGAEGVTQDALDALWFALRSNAALMYIKLEEWSEAAESARVALEGRPCPKVADADRAKALYRRGLALARLRDEDAAVAALERARELAPADAAVTRELAAVKKRAADRDAREKAAYKKFFS